MNSRGSRFQAGDPRDRADAMLARARARRGYVVTPEDATSPMDAMNTMQIPRAVIRAAEGLPDEPETTRSLPGPAGRSRAQAPERTPEVAEREPQVEEWETELADPPTGPLPALADNTITTHVRPPTRSPSPEPRETQPREAQPREAHPRQVDGLIPTIQEPSERRSSLSRRLDGDAD